MHLLLMRSPKTSIHGSPGPSQVTGPEPSAPSPGSKMSFFGVAVVVTEMYPAGVGTPAVALTGTHINGFTQNHVPSFTTPR